MITVILTLLCVIVLYIVYEAVRYSQLKKHHERTNTKNSSKSYKKRKVSKSNSKVSKAEAQNKRKPGRPKKQTKK
jgi:predicted Holliday junction resolvase-like endonuclease